MKRNLNATAVGAAFAVTFAFAGGAAADGLPSTIAMSAYEVGSAMYGQMVGLGSAFKNERGITLRVLPGRNDVSRHAPLRDRKVQFMAQGIGSWQAFEGGFVFGRRDWGPQQPRLVLTNSNDGCLALIVAGDIGVKTLEDLRGKRVAWVKGGSSLNLSSTAILAFAGLGWDDVRKVEVGGYAASLDGIVENRIDAAFTVTTAGFATKIAASPRGGFWPPMLADDKEGWERLKKVGPYYFPNVCKDGAVISEPTPGASYANPVIVSNYDLQDDWAYQFTRYANELYPVYKDSAPGANGYAIERQVFDWVVPYHPASIRYYTERGVWKPEHQANQDALLAREKVILAAWNAFRPTGPSDNDAFEVEWAKARVAALRGAGLEPYFETWKD